MLLEKIGDIDVIPVPENLMVPDSVPEVLTTKDDLSEKLNQNKTEIENRIREAENGKIAVVHKLKLEDELNSNNPTVFPSDDLEPETESKQESDNEQDVNTNIPKMEFKSKKELVEYIHNVDNNRSQVVAMKYIFDKNSTGHIFITGWAGTGKSTFLKRILPFLGDYGVVAPTGIAALNIQGSTIHSYFSFNMVPYWPEFKNGKFKNHIELYLTKEKRAVIRKLKFLVIDEMSMVRADLLDRVAEALRMVRGSNEPFGGVRLIMMGDLSQLPPVLKDDDPMLTYYDTRFFFSSKALMASGFKVVIFDKVYRQKDPRFINILNDIRNGNLSKESEEILNTRVVGGNAPSNAIYICSTNSESSSINSSSLQRNMNPAFSFISYKEGDAPKDAPCEDILTVKVDARVVMTKNGPGYVNGSMGKVTKIVDDRSDPEKSYIEVLIDGKDKPSRIKRETWEKIKYTVAGGQILTYAVGKITQFPMRLGYSISAHKSQGMTLDSVILKMNKAFESGQVYTAISRCRSLEGLFLTSPILQKYIHIDDDINRFYRLSKENDGVFKPIPIKEIAENMHVEDDDEDDIDFDFYL